MIKQLSKRKYLAILDPEYTGGPAGGAPPGEYEPNDGYVRGKSTSSLADAKTSGAADTADDDGSLIYVGQSASYTAVIDQTTWYVYRGFIKFDTTSIPPNAVIQSAKLKLYFSTDYSDYADFKVRVQKWTGDTPIGTEDFAAFDGVNYDDGGWNTAGKATGQYYDINIVNFDLIEKGGYTKVCLRSQRDIDCVGPPAGATNREYVGFSSNEGGDPPKLYIVYTIPVVKRLIGDALAYVVA